MGSETQREAAWADWRDTHSRFGGGSRKDFFAGWDARSVALPSRDEVAEVMAAEIKRQEEEDPSASMYVGRSSEGPGHVVVDGSLDLGAIAAAVLSLLSGGGDGE